MQLQLKFFSIFFVLLPFFFIGCGENFSYSETKELANNQWTYADTVSFTVHIEDTARIFNLYLDIDHTLDYPFQNLYIKVHTNFPDGQRLSEQVNVDMADKAGQWYGNCRGEHCTLRVNLQEGAYFNQPGEYTITFEQYMRENPLLGVKGLSFRMEDTGERRN